MTEPHTLLDETFHALAQPLMALRATVELGLAEAPSKLDAPQVLGECLRLLDQLTDQMSIMREIASVENAPSLESRDGDAILRGCADEMATVAQEYGVAIHVDASVTMIECDEPTFRRAAFVLLDAMIAAMPHGGEIRLGLIEDGDCLQLVVSPETRAGLRHKLCWKLMQAAGGSAKTCADGSTSVMFRKASCRQLQ